MELVPWCMVITTVSPQMPYILLLWCVVTKQMFSDTDEIKICRTKFGIVIRLYSNHWVGISAGEWSSAQ